MRGLWRPMVTYGAASVAATALMFFDRGPISLGSATLFALGAVPMPLFLTLRGVLPSARFLAGLRDGGLRYQIVSDQVGWFGDRRLTVRTEAGFWHIHTRNGGTLELQVRGPHMPRRHDVRGDWRRSGMLAAKVRPDSWRTRVVG